MEDLVDKIISCNIEELPHIIFPKNELFGLIILFRNVKYEFLINLKENTENLIVLGAGALGFDSKHDRTKPYFNRWSWEFEESTICYNDPTLYLNENLRGGWGVGNEEDYFLENIGEIIKSIADNASIRYENILFFGSSMGGFMSIMLSVMVKGSTALADIPQLSLESYFEWEDLQKYCFPTLNEHEILKKFKHRFNVISLMSKENYIPNAILIFDCSVTHDIEMQYVPFIKDLNQLPFKDNDNNIKILINGKNAGHAPLNKEDTLFLINETVKKNLMNFNTEIYNSNLFKENNYLKNNMHDKIKINDFYFEKPFGFNEVSMKGENSIKLCSNFMEIYVVCYGRNGNFCEEGFSNSFNNIILNNEYSFISSETHNFSNIDYYNLFYKNMDSFGSIYYFCKNNKTFRISFKFNQDYDISLNFATKIIESIHFKGDVFVW